MIHAKPFLRWAGGKRGLLQQYDPLLPKSFNRFYEPFLGGGAVFFHLFNQGKIGGAVLSDINEELIICYRAVRNDLHEVILDLKAHQQAHNEEYYYYVRSIDPANLYPARQAARTIYLNKTCFNGLYRVNRKGQFNVPIGSYENPTICNEDALIAASHALKNVDTLCMDFDVSSMVEPNDFVCFDPPYHAIPNFTGYTKHRFDGKEQIRLNDAFTAIHEKNCRVMLSNSDTDFIQGLYYKYQIDTVLAKRSINSKGDGRGKVNELVIRNYGHSYTKP